MEVTHDSTMSSSLSLQSVLFNKRFFCIQIPWIHFLCLSAFGAMAMPVLDLEESLKEYLNAEDVFTSMPENEFDNLLEGIRKGHYKHVEEVFADISELGVVLWIDSMNKACQVRELGAMKRFATSVAKRFRTEADASSQRACTVSAKPVQSFLLPGYKHCCLSISLVVRVHFRMD